MSDSIANERLPAIFRFKCNLATRACYYLQLRVSWINEAGAISLCARIILQTRFRLVYARESAVIAGYITGHACHVHAGVSLMNKFRIILPRIWWNHVIHDFRELVVKEQPLIIPYISLIFFSNFWRRSNFLAIFIWRIIVRIYRCPRQSMSRVSEHRMLRATK